MNCQNATLCSLLPKLINKSNDVNKEVCRLPWHMPKYIIFRCFFWKAWDPNYFTLNDFTDSCKWEIDSSKDIRRWLSQGTSNISESITLYYLPTPLFSSRIFFSIRKKASANHIVLNSNKIIETFMERVQKASENSLSIFVRFSSSTFPCFPPPRSTLISHDLVICLTYGMNYDKLEIDFS